MPFGFIRFRPTPLQPLGALHGVSRPAPKPSPSHAGPVRRLEAPTLGGAVPTVLPGRVGLGVNTIHRYNEPQVEPSNIVITVFTPVLAPGQQGAILDTNAKSVGERLPEVFVLGDAGITRAFIGVDQRPGTALSRRLDDLVARLPRGPNDTPAPEATIDFVRREINNLISWTPGSQFNDGRKEFPWDKAIKVSDKVWETFRGASNELPGHHPIETGETFPVVPFERYLELGQGYCLQKALLGALLLERAGVPCRLVNGAVLKRPGVTIGHTWLELADGRVLDPAWRLLEPADKPHALNADWFRLGGSYRFRNQFFPYLRLDT